eukprot:533136-Prymnesium_polylepis.1
MLPQDCEDQTFPNSSVRCERLTFQRLAELCESSRTAALAASCASRSWFARVDVLQLLMLQRTRPGKAGPVAAWSTRGAALHAHRGDASYLTAAPAPPSSTH